MATLTTAEVVALQNAALNGSPCTMVNTQGLSTPQKSDLSTALTKMGMSSYNIDAYNIVVVSPLLQLLVNQTV